MLIKFIKWAWSMRGQFVKYFIIGVTGVVLDITLLFVFKEYFGLTPVLSVVFNQILVLAYVFFLNKYWAFKSVGMTGQQMIRFFIVAGGNYLFAIFWMWLLNNRFAVNYLLARIINVALSVAWNFLLYRYFVFVNSAKKEISENVNNSSFDLSETITS